MLEYRLARSSQNSGGGRVWAAEQSRVAGGTPEGDPQRTLAAGWRRLKAGKEDMGEGDQDG